LLEISESITSTPPILFVLDILLIYLGFYICSSQVRDWATTNKIRIMDDLKIDPTAILIVITLIIAAVTMLAAVGGERSHHDQDAINRGYQWLAGAALFSFGQLILTRQVSGFTVYLAVAATDSLWWCLAWSLWALFQTLIPKAGWTLIFALGPIAVVMVTLGNVLNMLGPN
jgi:hypothetical protein